MTEAVYDIGGLRCAGCVRKVEGALSTLDGVDAVSVDLLSAQAVVVGSASSTAVSEQVSAAGFAAELHREGASAQLELGPGLLRLIAAVVSAAATMAVAWTLHLPWLVALLATLAVIATGPELLAGLRALLRRSPDMHSLIFLGVATAWASSLVGLLAPGLFPAGTEPHHFGAAATIAALVLVGRRLEAGARRKAGDAVEALQARLPRQVERLNDQDQVESIPIAEVVIGDRLRLRPGSTVPADGTVESGRSAVDEALISGEPLPVAKGPGDQLAAGTVLVDGSLVLRCAAVGPAATLGRIAAQVARARRSKAPIARQADRIAGTFVPVVTLIAIAVAVLWWLIAGPAMAVATSVAVLVIACPCALGLATPAAVTVALGRAAQLGILIRDATALEELGRLRWLGIDKTGTLTRGEPVLEILLLHPDVDEAELRRLIAGAEAGSEHPLGRALFAAADDAPPATSFTALAGLGVEATVDGRVLVIGSEGLFAERGIDAGPLAADAQRLADKGLSPVLVAVDGKAAAVLGLGDRVREEAAEALAALGPGIEVAVISGDRSEAVQATADSLGISRAHGRQSPESKASLVAAAPTPAAFAGDGLNDAPALAAAAVGIAVGSGTDVARAAAAVTLPGDDLRGLSRAVALGRAALSTIRGNLVFAFVYNVLAIPLAAGVLFPFTGWLLPPGLAAGMMALSSLCVVGNALRLRGWRPSH